MKRFCENCRKDTPIKIRFERMTANLKYAGEFRYIGKVAICKRCGGEVWTPETNDYNLTKLYKKVNRRKKLLKYNKQSS